MKKIFFLACLFIISSCKDDNNPNQTDVDRKAILENLGNIIVVQYTALEERLNLLETALTNLEASPTLTNINVAQTAFNNTYKAWQSVQFLQFGPAESPALRTIFNFYPADTVEIISAIQSGSVDVSTLGNDAQGLPALEFLLFGNESNDQKVLDFITANEDALPLIFALIDKLQTQAKSVSDTWKNAYKSTFTNQEGVDVGSSFGIMTNAIISDMEAYCRDGKVGIPLGVRTLGTPQLNLIEGKKSNTSLTLLLTYIQAYKSFFKGATGLGYDDYLNTIGAKYNDQNLSDAILQQLAVVETKIGTLNEPFALEISNNKPAVEALYQELQKLTILLKIDMASSMSILITYQDADGD